MKYCPIILLFFSLLSNTLTAQDFTQTIRGTVTDKNNGIPIPGATIIILNTNPLVGTSSDINGEFRFEKIKIGNLDLKISMMGYNDVVIPNLVVNTGKELVINVEMDEKIISIKEVVINGDSKTVPLNNMTSISTRVFTIEETERYAGARVDVGRMASNFAGVVGNNDARNDIVIRGNAPSGLLWRLEGVDIPNPNHFAAFGTTGGPICMLKINMLANSDFITSSFPAEYGNAISGVFDLKMRKGNNQKHEFMAQFGFNGMEGSAEGPISKKNGSSYNIDYSYSMLDFFSKLNVEMGTGKSIPKYQDLSFKIDFPRTKIGHLSFFGLGGYSNIALLDSKKDTNKKKIDFYGIEGWDVTNYSSMAVSGLTNTIVFNPKTYAKITLAGIYHNFTVNKDSLTPVTLAKNPYERSNFNEIKGIASLIVSRKIDVHHNFKIGTILTTLNYDLMDSLFYPDANEFKDITKYKGTTFLLQTYVEWQYKIWNNLTLNPGIQYIHLFYNQTASLEPRIGLKWNFLPNQSINLGYGRHSQTIPISLFYRQVEETDGSYRKTNDQLGFIRSNHYVAGYEWNITKYLRLMTEVYYQEITHVPVDGSKSSDFSALNLGANFDLWSPDTLSAKGSGQNYGLDFTLERFMNKGFYFLVTASLYDSKYKGSDGIQRNTVFNGNSSVNLLTGKEFILKGKNTSKRQKSIVLNLKSVYSGGQRYTPINISESMIHQTTVFYDDQAFSRQYNPYNRTDLKVSFKMNGKKFTVEWALEVMNVFNQKNVYSQYLNRKTGEINYTYQLGRTFMPCYRIYF